MSDTEAGNTILLGEGNPTPSKDTNSQETKSEQQGDFSIGEEEHQTKSYDGIATLDEPVSETIMRDLRLIYSKLLFILNVSKESDNVKELRNWDLWGPFAFCLLLSIQLSVLHGSQVDTIFSTVFLLVTAGSMIVTLNAKLLGSNASLLQNISILGYCLGPLILSSSFGFIPLMPRFINFIINIACVGWAIKCAIGPICSVIPTNKSLMVAFPIGLFFVFLDWFILLQGFKVTPTV